MMNYRPDHLADITRRGVLCFDMLTEQAQAAAVQNIIATEKWHHAKNVEEARTRLRKDLHGVINDPHFISRMLRTAKNLHRVINDPSYCRQYILQNLCEFDAAGRYTSFLPGFVVINVAAAA